MPHSERKRVETFHTLANDIQLEIHTTIAGVDSDQIDTLVAALRQARRIFLTGNGRTGLQMRAFAIRLMHLGLKTHVVGEATTPAIDKQDLLLIGSCTGTNISHIHYSSRSLQVGARTILITANAKTPLRKIVSHVLYIPASSSSRQPLGSLFEGTLNVVLDALVLQLMKLLDVNESEMAARHANLE